MKGKSVVYVSLLLMVAMPFRSIGQSRLVIDTSELPPYVSRNREDSFFTELLDEIAKEMGLQFDYHYLPWLRCEEEVEHMKAWATMPYVKSADRLIKFSFSEPLFDRRTMFFYYSKSGKPKQIPFEKLSDIKGYRIGGVKGYYYEEQFADAGLSVEYVNAEEQNFRKLKAEHVDLIPAEEILGWHIIKSMFAPEEQKCFFTLNKPLTIGSIYLMSSKNYPDGDSILKRFNEALARIKKTGTYAALIKKHELYPNRD